MTTTSGAALSDESASYVTTWLSRRRGGPGYEFGPHPVDPVIVRLWLPRLGDEIDWHLSSVGRLPALYEAIGEGQLGEIEVMDVLERAGVTR